jgi:soluble lytic murein transglycosylase
MFKRAISILLFLSTIVFAKPLTLDFFKDKPRSFAKDFYISQFLDQAVSSKDAKALVGQVKNMNFKLFYKFADKIDDFGFKRVKYCKKLNINLYEGKSADCIAIGLSNYKATKLTPATLNKISENIRYRYPKIANQYKIIASKSFDTLLKADEKEIIEIFTTVGSKYRESYYNKSIDADKLIKLSKHRSFGTMIEKIVRNPKLINLQKSILKFDSSNLTAEANFLLALNAIKLQHEDIANWYLQLSEKKARLQQDKDKALFWRFLITKDKSLLNKLLKSKDINIFTLYAHERLGIKSKSIITSIEPKKPKAPFDVKDPFAWIKAKEAFKSKRYSSYEVKRAEALKLNSNETEAHVARLIYKFQRDEHYFLTPYLQYLVKYNKHRVALILALARQESQFIPTSISYSYALGMMQFMPYVAKDIAQKSGFKDFKYEDMFDPKTAYQFANIHLDFLERSLFHPLFIAYAYNGGLGFTKRKIIKKGYFKDGKYEPFLSMEMIPNSQARHYGKRVLANYAVYAKLLGINEQTIINLLKTLKPPHRTSRF